MATFLEEKPLAKEAKDYRAALLFFLAEVPDITVKICTGIKPKAKFRLMDELLQKQQAGTLAEHVKAGMSGCKG
jgi:hypothetical protein